MTTATSTTGRPTGGKPINLSQLQTELSTAGVVSSSGLGLVPDVVFTYDAVGAPCDFAAADQQKVDQVIAAHLALRDKTDAEYSTEFQNPATTPARRQEIRDIMAGLLPREQVPM